MKPRPAEKEGMHPRNLHRVRYDFSRLIEVSPALASFVRPNPHGENSIDYADPDAVTALNRALLHQFYGIASWEIPAGYLCPPVPGRADYIHHAADLLASDHGGKIPRGPAVTVLDIGVGANCIYPIIGSQAYGWSFVGSEIDPIAIRSAQAIVAANPALTGRVEIRPQASSTAIFRGVVRPGEMFDLSICNPPFHASRAEAVAGTRRKLGNLRGRDIAKSKTILNFGGRAAELWCAGGELAFVRRMIAESPRIPTAVRWFTTLVSKAANLPGIQQTLDAANPADVRIIEMSQGQKQSRIVAWRFGKP